jgi:hypothetical protein
MWRIRNWNDTFENSQSRKYGSISWVPIPNRHDTDGYTRLIEHEHGAMHYGAWIALVQLASRCKPRGTLRRGDGRPHDLESVARITRIGAHVFAQAIPRFLSVEIGWLENMEELPREKWEQTGSTLGACYPERNGTERNRTEKNFRPDGEAVGFVQEGWNSETWTKARELCSDAASRLWPYRRSRLLSQDRNMLLQAAYLAVVRFSQDWWQTALEETVKAKAKKPIALFKTCLWKRPRAEGIDLNALIEAVLVPDAKAGGDAPSAPADLSSVGSMPEDAK